MLRDRRNLKQPKNSIVVALALLVTGCGGHDEGNGPSTEAKPRPLTISVTEPSPGRFRYFAPKSVRGGLVEIRFTTVGQSPHKAQLWRVGDGHTVEEARNAGSSPRPEWLVTAGGVGVTAPDRTGRTIQRLRPGRYYVGGHLREKGTVARIRVTAGGGRPGKLPRAKARVIARDHSFTVSGLRAGRQRIEFRNAGREPHHVYFAPLRRGASLGEVRAALAGKRIEPPPFSFKRGRDTAVIEGGDRQVTEITLARGRYALLCFVRDRAGGATHNEKGMISEVRVR